jgi:4-hydroxy-tetrahydrodipicolinate synthase
MVFSGSYVALITPWSRDLSAIDYGALRDLVEWQIASGTDGIVAAGSTGESATMSHPEHNEFIAKTVEMVGGRCRVLAGAGSNNTAESTALAKAALAAGADALLVITPYYNRPTQEGLYRHYAAIAECTPLPIMVYNVPSRTGCNLLPDTLARIHRGHPHVDSVKEASGNVDQSSQILQSGGISVLSGDDSLTLPIMAVGGTGVVSVIANVAPRETKLMVDAALAGDFARAREWHHRLFPLMKACFVETNPGPVKAAMRLMGKDSGTLRLPMAEPGPESGKIIRETLRGLGIAMVRT